MRLTKMDNSWGLSPMEKFFKIKQVQKSKWKTPWNASGLIACMSQAKRLPSSKLVVLQGDSIFPLSDVALYYILMKCKPTLDVQCTVNIVFLVCCEGAHLIPIFVETNTNNCWIFCSRVLLYVQMILYGAPILMLIRCLYTNQPCLQELKEFQLNLNG